MFFLTILKKYGFLDKVNITICIAGSRKIVSEDDYEIKGWTIFAPNLKIYGFEPDVQNCKQMNEDIQSRKISWLEQHFPIGLSNEVGTTKLYVTNFPGCSSLYPPNEKYMERFEGYANLIKLSLEIPIKVTTLDHFCQTENIQEIDFIQLDVQGAELKILQGANSILKNVLGVLTEVSFIEVYKNQPLFSDIDVLMRKNGFSFVDLIVTRGKARRTISPIVSKERQGSLIWADAIYFRDLIGHNVDYSLKTPDKIFKLACLADMLDFSDLAIEMLEYLTLNYGIHNPDYNFADIIVEGICSIDSLFDRGIENLPIIQRIQDYTSRSLSNLVNQFKTEADKLFEDTKIAVVARDKQIESYLSKKCKFLQSRSEIVICTEYLHKNGYVSHNVECKDWDLAHIIHDLSDGNILDMGSSDSYILKNVVLKNIQGEKYGIDLRSPDIPVKAVKYVIGDLMNTGFPNEYFQNITCLSVIEHQVNVRKLVMEVSRILQDGGKLYLTFDYWNPKLQTNIKLYGLAWSPLDQYETQILIREFESKNLYLVDEMDWSLHDEVIREGYYSPQQGINYTFGMLVLKKDVKEGNKKKKAYEVSLLNNLRLINLIICPDWMLPEDQLLSNLEQVIHALIKHPNSVNISLFMEINNIIEEEEAQLIVSSAIMNVMMMADTLEENNLPEVSLVDLIRLGERKQSFLSNLNACIQLTQENEEIINLLSNYINNMITINEIDQINNKSI